MRLQDLFDEHAIGIDLHPNSKKQLFQDMAELLISGPALSGLNIDKQDIVIAAAERERLGSTGVGHGVALPHARLEGLDRVYAAFARLDTPMDYNAIDDRPVDLVVMLLAPMEAGGAHLRALAQISRQLRREDTRSVSYTHLTLPTIYPV